MAGISNVKYRVKNKKKNTCFWQRDYFQKNDGYL